MLKGKTVPLAAGAEEMKMSHGDTCLQPCTHEHPRFEDSCDYLVRFCLEERKERPGKRPLSRPACELKKDPSQSPEPRHVILRVVIKREILLSREPCGERDPSQLGSRGTLTLESFPRKESI